MSQLASIICNNKCPTQALGAHHEKMQSHAAAANERLLALLAALERAMAAPAYLAALVLLVRDAVDAPRRRALRLLTDKLDTLHSSTDVGNMERESLHMDAADAVLGLVADAPSHLESRQPAVTRQAFLGALAAMGRAFGAVRAASLLPAIVAALDALTDTQCAVRGSAFATLAALVACLGSSAMPTLPRLLPEVLGAADRAAVSLPDAQTAAAVGVGERSGVQVGI